VSALEDKLTADPVPDDTPKKSDLRMKLGVTSPADIEWLNLMVYGDPGVGKTHLLGTAMDHPDTSPLLLLDVDGGMTTLRKRPDVDVVTVRSYDDVMRVCLDLKENNNGYYKTVGIDSLTELQKLDMAGIMRDVVLADRSRDPDIASLREWGKTGEHIRRIVRNYRDLSMNVIFTAHAMQDKDEIGVPTYWPSLPGKMRTEVAGFLDVVGYMHVKVDKDENLVRTIQFAKTKKVTAKDRTDSLGGEIVNPTIPELWHRIFGY
jgi:phage nucleotide-binding protein